MRTKNQIAGLVAAACIVVGSLLPWAELTTIFGTITRSGTDGDGVYTLILGAVTAALFFSGNRGASIAALVLSALVTFVAIYDLIDVERAADEVEEGGIASASAGAGLWLTAAGGIVAVIASVRGIRAPSATPVAPPMPSAAPAGWYADPRDEAARRYWDGNQWTAHTSGTVAGPSFPPPQV